MVRKLTDPPAQPAHGAPAAVRAFSDDGSHILERLEGSSLVREGLVNVIVLDPIAERFAGRWPIKREAVYGHVERVLGRTLGPQGFFARVSDTDYVVVRPDLGPFGAQAACHRDFREIWQHFLGDAPCPSLTVHRVRRLTRDGMIAEPLDPDECLAGEAREAAARAHAAPDGDGSLLSLQRWSPFRAADGRELRASCVLEPVFSLRDYSRIAFRLRRKVAEVARNRVLTPAQVSALSRADLLRIDMATIGRGLARLASETGDGPALSLIVPVSYVSVAHLNSRKMLIEALGQASRAVRTGVICEIQDAEDVPRGRLSEAVAFIRPWCLLTAAHITERPSPGMREAGLRAISVCCPEGLAGDAEFIQWLRPVVQAGRKVARSVMVYGCGDMRRLAIAGVLGASHGSLAPSPDPGAES